MLTLAEEPVRVAVNNKGNRQHRLPLEKIMGQVAGRASRVEGYCLAGWAGASSALALRTEVASSLARVSAKTGGMPAPVLNS